jgi:flagellar hook-associated protein 2
MVNTLKEAGLNANFDATQQRIYISSKTAGTEGDFTLSAADGDSNSATVLSALGFTTEIPDGKTYEELDDDEKDKYARKLDGTDAEITLNGVRYTSNSNNFAINGLNITVTGTTGDDEITLTTDTDSQGIYDKIKDFLTEYNSVINEMNKLYNADSSYGYDPLTDDEKDAMSDTEIEKWETKIKDSLLRNDTTLNSVMMSMINAMSSSYTVNGSKMTLSSLGISTLGYLNAAENENYAYHIDGDSDDDNTSGNTDKLLAAIKSDPDSVVDFMKQLTSNLYTQLGNKMKSTTLSSAYTIYNDKEMNSQYSEYSTLISDWEDKLSDKEDYYYEKFANMESALTKLQSSTSSLTSMLG